MLYKWVPESHYRYTANGNRTVSPIYNDKLCELISISDHGEKKIYDTNENRLNFQHHCLLVLI